ncbi:hypothetical protein NQ317_006001 [Molorchus minor]|uniref:Uncharacterized protein n=1 Tax=Molorchus minor TaxID=1323400 RepID=A0ABQ9J2K8_9CUCU|nr:hypothetical protein NQ317_006001 [Molorchus minor]
MVCGFLLNLLILVVAVANLFTKTAVALCAQAPKENFVILLCISKVNRGGGSVRTRKIDECFWTASVVPRNRRYYRCSLAGAFMNATGTYDASFYLSGGVLLASAVMCYPLNWINQWERRRNEQSTTGKNVPSCLKGDYVKIGIFSGAKPSLIPCTQIIRATVATSVVRSIYRRGDVGKVCIAPASGKPMKQPTPLNNVTTPKALVKFSNPIRSTIIMVRSAVKLAEKRNENIFRIELLI